MSTRCEVDKKSEMISRENLSKLSGLTIAKLRQIASEGFFPKEIDGEYRASEAIAGIFRFFREKSETLPVYDSLEQCAGATGIPIGVLKSAKRKGSTAFRSNRVHLEALLRFLFDPKNGNGDHGTMHEERLLKLRAERKLAEKELQEKEQSLIHIDEAKVMCRNLFVPVRQRFDSLPTEACGKANPSDPKHAYAVLRQWADDSLSVLRESLPPIRNE
jgi:hypothetical protein